MNDSTPTPSLESVAPLRDGRFEIAAGDGRTLLWRGELAMRDPVAAVGGHVRRIHDAAAGGGELTVDVTALTFVNSSGLRVFLDWAAWIAAEPPARRYLLRFRTKKGVTWQAAAFPAIAMLGGENVRVESV